MVAICKFLERKTNISTFSDLREALRSDTTLPEVLNSRSEAALVAQAAKYFLANFDRMASSTLGYLCNKSGQQ